MSRLPPVEKFPLAVRKNIRDNWESKKGELEGELSSQLGVPWTVEVDLPQIAAYAKPNSFAAESPGSMVTEYVSGATRRLADFFYSNGEDGKKEINTACTSHVLTMDVDLDGKVDYCGCKIADGKLVILFHPDNLGSNCADALGGKFLKQALNDAPSAGGLSYLARKGIAEDYDKDIKEIQATIQEQLGRDVTLDPGFDAVAAKLTAANKTGFEDNLGSFVKFYFKGLASTLNRKNVKGDDMIQEAVNEELSSGKIAFRIVDNGSMKQTYGEAVFEGGILYVQTDPEHYGSNIDDAAQKVLDQL